MSKRHACIILASLLVTASAQASPAERAHGPVTFEAVGPRVTGHIEHLPMVLPGPAISAINASRINTSLHREDARGIAAAADCAGNLRQTDKGAADGGWERSVKVTMAGPRYLAYRISDSYYCGGPYPNDGIRSDFVYDLTTGRPVDWLRLFPSGARALRETAAGGATLGLVAWRQLSSRAAADAEPDCREAFGQEEYAGFTIGLDAASGVLTAQPAQFPHVIQACAEEVRLGEKALRKLGFDPLLVTSLERAHRWTATAR
jgi:hypothetical protein